ncbi:hypothetical protein [Staphylothermus marinus]|nr:hypothetical protein [Staphylothermus marinus]
MTTITIVLPDKVLEYLKKKAGYEDKSIEELIGEAILKILGINDP